MRTLGAYSFNKYLFVEFPYFLENVYKIICLPQNYTTSTGWFKICAGYYNVNIQFQTNSHKLKFFFKNRRINACLNNEHQQFSKNLVYKITLLILQLLRNIDKHVLVKHFHKVSSFTFLCQCYQIYYSGGLISKVFKIYASKKLYDLSKNWKRGVCWPHTMCSEILLFTT